MPPSESFVYHEIAESVRRLIVSGRLQPGDKLPSVRDMARTWHCTPNTVGRAYAVLATEGLVSSHRGEGPASASRTAARRPQGLQGSRPSGGRAS